MPDVSEPRVAPSTSSPDIRVGSSTNGLAPVSVPSARSAPGRGSGPGLAAVVGGRRRRRPADQARRRQPSRARPVGARRRARCRSTTSRTPASPSASSPRPRRRDRADRRRGRLDARLLRPLRRAPSGVPGALGLLIGGSLSNLVDRVRLGHVTDFIDFSWWPAFNLADSFIVIGVGILLAAMLGADRRPKRVRRPLDVAAARNDSH